jgi:hypothetical protein
MITGYFISFSRIDSIETEHYKAVFQQKYKGIYPNLEKVSPFFYTYHLCGSCITGPV